VITEEIVGAYRRTKWGLMLRGIVGVAIGAFILARPLDSVAAFALVIAVWALVDGIVNIVRAFDLRPVVPHWWVLLLAGLVSGAFGAAALYYYPALSLAFAVAWSAWWLITAGLLGIYAAIRERAAQLSWGWTMTFGVIALAIGLLAIMYPGVTLSALMGMIAAFGIVGGFVMLIGAGKMQSVEHQVKRTMEGRSETTSRAA
jgi:uncharacterized membrane protein HdeD (DUF308 family)